MLKENPLLQAIDLSLSFDGNIVLDKLSCNFYSGSLVSLVGPNGAGKTSFFNLISGHLKPDNGAIFLAGKNISHLSVPARVSLGLARGFQINQLFPNLSVFENICLSVAARFKKSYKFWSIANSESKINELSEQYLIQVGLIDLRHKLVNELSHGEQRKLEILLLIALESKVLLLDEPTAGLGVEEVPAIIDLINKIKNDENKLILLIEHKLEAVKELSDRMLVLYRGNIIADDKPAIVMSLDEVQQAYFGGL